MREAVALRNSNETGDNISQLPVRGHVVDWTISAAR